MYLIHLHHHNYTKGKVNTLIHACNILTIGNLLFILRKKIPEGAHNYFKDFITPSTSLFNSAAFAECELLRLIGRLWHLSLSHNYEVWHDYRLPQISHVFQFNELKSCQPNVRGWCMHPNSSTSWEVHIADFLCKHMKPVSAA